MNKAKVALLINKDMGIAVLGEKNREVLMTFAEAESIGNLPAKVTEEYMRETLKGADACITCWGTPPLTENVLREADGLKVIAHMAGTPRAIVSDAVWDRGIRVTTVARVIAQDVAETVLGLMIVSLKNMWKLSVETKAGNWGNIEAANNMLRLKGLNIGIISASKVGREVISLLKPFKTNIYLYDPMITKEESEALGCVKINSLGELMSISDVVTVHAPMIPATRHMINADNLKLMKEGSLFINTSRGGVVDEPALIEFLSKKKNFACLDVTDPEPPAADSPLRKLDNCILLPHIAGGRTLNNRLMQGEFIVNQLKNFFTDGTLQDEFTPDMFEYIA